MAIKCRKCENEFDVGDNIQIKPANLVNEDLPDSLDMILTCPHCSVRYNAFFDVRDDFENWVEI